MIHKQTMLRVMLLTLLVSTQALAEKLPVWEIQGTSNRVLLMGSIHFLRPADYPLPAGMDEAYELADGLYMEIDMDSIDPVASQGVLISMGTGGGSLRENLSPEAYAEADRRATGLGLPLMSFEQFEPWFAALTITQLRMMQLGFDPEKGVESYFRDKARSDGKVIYGLESLEEQLSFMDGLDADTQEEFLLQSLDDAAELEQQVDLIVTAWRTGDGAALEELMLEDLEAAPELADALLVQRNRNWLRPIKQLMNDEDNWLVIVGAMHLVGPESVVVMLEDQGVEISQLSSADLR